MPSSKCLSVMASIRLVLVIVSVLATLKFAHCAEFLREGVQILHHYRVVAKVATIDHQLKHFDKCNLTIVDPRDKMTMLRQLSSQFAVSHISFESMMDVVTRCEKLSRDQDERDQYGVKDEEYEEDVDFGSLLRGIVPGTKWCGLNDIADSYRDLGYQSELDRCCRAHDHCPIKIRSFDNHLGVFNIHPYTKSHCECDDLFYNCLKSSNSSMADAIGKIFFNVLRLQCLHSQPRRKCVRRRRPKLFFDLFGAKYEDECLGWEDDLTALPQVSFRWPRRRY